MWDGRIARLDRAHLIISDFRLLLAGVYAVVLWPAFVRVSLSLGWMVPPAAALCALVIMHARLLTRSDRARRAHRLYERGLARLDDRWIGTCSDGVRFLDGHEFARDLDLFGRGSLFELINTVRTEVGEVVAGFKGSSQHVLAGVRVAVR